MAKREVNNSEDILDTRDVLARIEELEADDERDEDDSEELAALLAFKAEFEGCSDWNYGEALIRETYFKTYAQELADDIGAIDRNANWPCNCIDWDEAADLLRQDYVGADFDGITYWIRG